MSKQLAISATASVCAMALFALGTSLGERTGPAAYETGAAIKIATPDLGQSLPAGLLPLN